MNELEKIEMLLRNRLVVLQSKVEEIDDELDETGDDDFEEMAVEAQGDQVLEGVGHAANDEIRLVKLALGRIEEGSYGECGGCGEAISKKRLEVLPHAILCVACESSVEQA